MARRTTPVLDLSRLNSPQRQAVVHQEGPELVLAGAGSGKTRVIANRVAWLIEQGVAPAAILAVTFTNKAAKETKDRVRDLAGSAGGKVHVATFHGFGLWFLRGEHRGAALPKWLSVCDAGDQVTLLKRCLRDVQVDSRRLDVRHLLGHLLAITSRRKNARFDRARAATGRGGEGDDYEAIAEELLPRYEQASRAQRSLDFDDLVVCPAALLEGDAVLRRAYRERFRHVLVDEYQDTNRVQIRLLELRCATDRVPEPGAGRGSRLGIRRASDAPIQDGWSRRSLCAVGDYDQAIYGWRGAEVRNIFQFEKNFPGATIVRLEQNHRSTGSKPSTARTPSSRDRRSDAPSDSGRTRGPATRCGLSISPTTRRRRGSSQGRSGGDWPKAGRRPNMPFCIG